jgi:hypothetical protein
LKEKSKNKKELGRKGIKPDELERLTKERAKLIPIIEELSRLDREIKNWKMKGRN